MYFYRDVLYIEAKFKLRHVCNNIFLCTALELKHILHAFNSPEEQEFLHIAIEKLNWKKYFSLFSLHSNWFLLKDGLKDIEKVMRYWQTAMCFL